MSKKSAISIVVILVIIALGVFGYFYYLDNFTGQNNDQNNGGIVDNILGNFFPSTTPPNQETNNEDQEFISEEDKNFFEEGIPKLRQISNLPVAGFTSFERKATTSNTFINEEGVETSNKTTETIFRYIDKATGHVYETTARDLSVLRLSNITIPKIYQALFDDSGDNFVYQIIGSDNYINSFVGSIIERDEELTIENEEDDNSPYVVESSFLPGDMTSLLVSPNKSRVFYSLVLDDPITSEKTVGYQETFDEITDPNIVFSNPLTEFNYQWFSNSNIALNTKPSSVENGYLYNLNINNGSLSKVLGPVLGLNSLTNPTGNIVIYSDSTGRDLVTYVYNKETKDSYRLNRNTLPAEKCIFSQENSSILYCAVPDFLISNADYPDSWYKGDISFNDSIWKFDLENNTYEQVLENLSETDQPLDIFNLQLSEDEDYLIFMNKKDLTLWSLDLI